MSNSTPTQIVLSCDARPLRLFIELLHGALQRRQRPFDFGELTFELARVENDFSATTTSELIVRLYPSDAFLRFASASLAGDFDLGTIKETGDVRRLALQIGQETQAEFQRILERKYKI